MLRKLGDVEQSWSYLEQAIRLFAGHADVSGVVLTLAAAAGIALDKGDVDRARRLAGASHGLATSSGTGIVRNDLNIIEGLEFETLEALSAGEAIPYREGKAMSLEHAVGYLLAGSGAG
jgi:hypothetical protein